MSKRNNSDNDIVSLIGYIILIVATVAGPWAVAMVVRDGHHYSATTQSIPWRIWLALYIFFLGLSAGPFLLSTGVYV